MSDWSIECAEVSCGGACLLGPHLFFELIDQCDRIDRTGPRRVENRLVIRAFRIHHNRDIVIAQLKHFGREPDAFGVARTDAAVDLDR